ncbi:hypothetical protein K523DRAFT_310714 [Schizophyllum commune Tattone D]|nr:hypothetical protein K523DRAFT_310714 [Schizophyllum commune Tattone D]
MSVICRHLMFNFSLAKIYTNSLMSSLNSRQGWHWQMDNVSPSQTEIPLAATTGHLGLEYLSRYQCGGSSRGERGRILGDGGCQW